VVALLTLLGVSYLAQGSQVVESGYHILQLTAELRALQEENTYLEAEIAASQSVERLQQRARTLGFWVAGPDQIEYLLVENYPPAPGPAVVLAPETQPAPADGLVGWWRGLTRGFTGWTRSTVGRGF